jgi:uncharacterized protein YdhG (YjbR/CyaY superfamily)
MAAKKRAGKAAKPARRGAATSKGGGGFTAEEREAMRERARELKAAKSGADGAGEVLARLATMPAPDRAIGERLHAIITASAPELTPRLWYGMPAYSKDGKVLCFFQNASKFKTRYSTFGFTDQARLDDGAMWATGFALQSLTRDGEERIAALVKKAVGS